MNRDGIAVHQSHWTKSSLKRSDLARCDVTTSKNAGLFFQYIQEALGFGRCIMQKERSNIIT